MDHRRRKVNTVLFALYLGALFWVLFHREPYHTDLPYWGQVSAAVNLMPLRTVRLYLRLIRRGMLTKLAVTNLVGNLILFLPLGGFLPVLFPALRRLWKTLAVCTLVIVAVELSQVLLLLGSCDVDDLILNLLGASAGYGLAKLLKQ